jgi:hypothetical protein
LNDGDSMPSRKTLQAIAKFLRTVLRGH